MAVAVGTGERPPGLGLHLERNKLGTRCHGGHEDP